MKGTILYGESNAHVLCEQIKIFEKAGFTVIAAIGRRAVEEAIRQSAFDLVILGHTLTKDDRHHLPYIAKKSKPATRILVLHASCKHPKVDISMDSRDGERALLQAVAQLLPSAPAKKAMAAVA